MVQIVFGAAVGRDLQSLGVGISQSIAVQTSAGPGVIALSGRGGGLVSLGFNGAGTAYVSDIQYFSSDFWAATYGRLALLPVAGREVAAVATQGANQLVGYTIDGSQIGAMTGLTGTGIAASTGTIYQESGGFLFAASADGYLRSFRLDGTAGAQAVQTLADTARSFHATPGAMADITLHGRHYLFTTCLKDVGISAFEVNATTGALRQTGTMCRDNGLGLFEKPVAMATTVLGDRGYIIIGSAPESGTSAALSVLEVLANGQLQATDHIMDSLSTRFGRISGLAVVEHNGWSYVIAQGGDMGVSLFTLMPGGQLLHLNSFVGTAATTLASQSALSAVMTGNQLQILVSTHAEVGFTQLRADLSNQGQVLQAGPAGGTLTGGAQDDMLIGGAGADALNGGNGADILNDGAGMDWLVGGAGADRFVLVFDGVRDVIADFDPTSDSIDLSLVPMLYSTAQIEFISQPWGAILNFRGEELQLRSANGGALSQAQVMAAILWGVDRPPMMVTMTEEDDNSGDDTLYGSDMADVLLGGLGNDCLYGLAGNDNLQGEDGSDTLYGGDGNDTAAGGNGNDVIYLDAGNDRAFGGDGNDMLYGGDYFDTLYGGEGNDTIDGGNGRDLVFLNQGNDLYIDNTQGGEFGQDTVYAGYGDDTIQGGNGDDAFYGEWGNDLIYARLGNDSVVGGGGDDTLLGGDGLDTIWGDDGNDVIYGENGNDVIYGGSQFDTIYGGDGNDTVDGGDGRDLVFLNQGNDLYIDNAQGGAFGQDTVYAGYGDDTIQGGDGNDMFYGEWGNDVIYAGLGNDTVHGGDYFDFIDAGDGDDLVFGDNGCDTVFLGNGNDIYVDTAQTGIYGQDTITGGAGADQFEFQAVMSADVITDFELGIDDLRLTQSLWGGGLSAAQVVSTYARVTANGVLLDFGGGQSILLQGLTTTTGLYDDIFLV